jgi:hypothetical protein
VASPGEVCNGGGAGCNTLTDVLSDAVSHSSGAPCELRLGNGSYSLDSSATGTSTMVFDASSAASSVILSGDAGVVIQVAAAGHRRRTSHEVEATSSFLEVRTQAPPVTLRGLIFEGSQVTHHATPARRKRPWRADSDTLHTTHCAASVR